MRTPDRETRGSTAGLVAVLAARLTEAAAVLGSPRAAEAVAAAAASGPAVAGQAALNALTRCLELLWQRGWLPAEAVRAVPRPLSALASAAVAHACAGFPAAGLHPRWRADLAELGPPRPLLPGPLTPGLTSVVELVAALMALPRLPRTAPAPGGFTGATDRAGVDRRVLERVRGLLAKAESTPFAAEAEALSAKAQELMARYAFEQAVLTADEPVEAATGRLWLDAPYQGPKAQLVDAVATANHCRAVFYARLGCVALVGHETDLEIVQVLAESLLVQSARALRRAPATGRSYRHAFLVAYAHRVQQRLTEATAHARPDSTALVPVLASRTRAVETKFDTLFPGIRTRRTTVTNPTGWTAGLAAADQADLHPHRAVAS
ncbi:DUF2786 domain-containing protein [Actinokineospora sp. NBRC 105648]|uniref:DUF2786 domain-containing protein n=1 Tax=Actinokineospora sp. NBRC 105648 TaxID=3032206 RepID=UPI002555DBAC|nr:DUF2786 domain-containing protein [Actinokineospora sp. NBRC 105648]